MIIRASVTFFALLFLSFPALAQESPRALQEAMIAAAEAEDAEAVAALYAPDAVDYPFGFMSVSGQVSIKALWEGIFQAYDIGDISVDTQDDIFGNKALTWGTWSMTFIPKTGGDPIVLQGRITYMSKKLQGDWKYFVTHISKPLPLTE